jgi:hypothetical protein
VLAVINNINDQQRNTKDCCGENVSSINIRKRLLPNWLFSLLMKETSIKNGNINNLGKVSNMTTCSWTQWLHGEALEKNKVLRASEMEKLIPSREM